VSTGEKVARLSRWIDEHNIAQGRDPEALTWGRLAKMQEEAGEVISAYIGVTGQNPRKGVTHYKSDVIDEVLDVIVTGMGALEHLTDNQGLSLVMLQSKVDGLLKRAGLEDS
jgi:hypothetical protein